MSVCINGLASRGVYNDEMKIFYSWQSDIPENRKFIIKWLKQAIGNRTDFEIDSATRGAVGSPDISANILSKIDESSLFLADVSIINSTAGSERKTPNPNVLYELGYAVKALGEENIILIANKQLTNTADLPFDIRNRRMILVEFSESSTTGVVGSLKSAMSNYHTPEPVSEDEVPPFVTHHSGELVWAGNYSGFGAGFLTRIDIDNYGGDKNYLTSLVLKGTNANGDPWMSKIFMIRPLNLNNAPLLIEEGEMLSDVYVFLSEDTSVPQMMPDLDRDTITLHATFRSGKTVILPPFKPGLVKGE